MEIGSVDLAVGGAIQDNILPVLNNLPKEALHMSTFGAAGARKSLISLGGIFTKTSYADHP